MSVRAIVGSLAVVAVSVVVVVLLVNRDHARSPTEAAAVSPAPGHVPAGASRLTMLPVSSQTVPPVASVPAEVHAFSTNGMDEAVARKMLDALRGQLKETTAQGQVAYQTLYDIQSKAMKEDVQLVELQSAASRKRAELDQLLAKAPAIVELNQKKAALEHERAEAVGKRDAAFKAKTDLKRRKVESGDTSPDSAIEKLDTEEQDMNRRLKELPDRIRAVARELASKRTELARVDPTCAELATGAQDADMAFKRRVDSIPEIAAQNRICTDFRVRMEELEIRIFKVSSVLQTFQAASNVVQVAEGSALTNKLAE